MVQVGEGDELYPVDLRRAEAAADLAGHERVFEIWPPLDAPVDRDGRRVEAIVAVVAQESSPTRHRRRFGPASWSGPPAPPGAAAGRLAHLQAVRRARRRQDALLTGTVVPTVARRPRRR